MADMDYLSLALQKQKKYEDEANQSLAAYQNALNEYNNRPKFEYDVNADALYQQYKDQYEREGAKAMEDTIGKASALTGGYANSYAQAAGQEVYNDYLNKVNDIVPSLYNIAYSKYQDEGKQILQKADNLGDIYKLKADLASSYGDTATELQNNAVVNTEEGIKTNLDSLQNIEDTKASKLSWNEWNAKGDEYANNLANQLDSLVASGTLTQDQAQSYYNTYMDSYDEQRLNYNNGLLEQLMAGKITDGKEFMGILNDAISRGVLSKGMANTYITKYAGSVKNNTNLIQKYQVKDGERR